MVVVPTACRTRLAAISMVGSRERGGKSGKIDCVPSSRAKMVVYLCTKELEVFQNATPTCGQLLFLFFLTLNLCVEDD